MSGLPYAKGRLTRAQFLFLVRALMLTPDALWRDRFARRRRVRHTVPWALERAGLIAEGRRYLDDVVTRQGLQVLHAQAARAENEMLHTCLYRDRVDLTAFGRSVLDVFVARGWLADVSRTPGTQSWSFTDVGRERASVLWKHKRKLAKLSVVTDALVDAIAMAPEGNDRKAPKPSLEENAP